MDGDRTTQLVHFLEHELAVSPSELALLQHHPERENAPLPMLLWQYGLVSMQQLTQIFDWMEAQVSLNLDG